MKIDNIIVNGLEESIIASGYPMQTNTPSKGDFIDEVNTVSHAIYIGTKDFNSEDANRMDKHLNRVKKLAQTPKGSGHDQFLTGIIVSFDLTCTNKMWVELERYRFINFVSSQSTMHRIAKFDLKNQYNEYVDDRMIDVIEELKDKYNKTQNKEDYLKLLYSNPAGFELTARLTTNYRALKTVYSQRKNHRLPEWREFCKWIETLPMSNELIIGA